MCVIDDIKRAVIKHDMKELEHCMLSLRQIGYSYDKSAWLFEFHGIASRQEFEELMQELQ